MTGAGMPMATPTLTPPAHVTCGAAHTAKARIAAITITRKSFIFCLLSLSIRCSVAYIAGSMPQTRNG